MLRMLAIPPAQLCSWIPFTALPQYIVHQTHLTQEIKLFHYIFSKCFGGDPQAVCLGNSVTRKRADWRSGCYHSKMAGEALHAAPFPKPVRKANRKTERTQTANSTSAF